MPATYSVNIGTQFESSVRADITAVLKELPDNTSKLISPRDVRDAFLTTWASSPIKQTRTISGTEYIGIDSGNPGNRDIKQKILLGKRNFGNNDVMSSSLLSDTSADIYIYNTKSDSVSQDSTTMAFLAGTNSSLYTNAPYIGSSYNSVTGNIDFNVRNPMLNSGVGGNINLYSNSGYILLNGIRFPKVSENNADATNGKILRYVGNFPNGYLQWSSSNTAISSLGVTNKVTNIYGGTVSLNGYELEFVNPDMTPSTVGGIPAGFSFSATSFNGKKWPLSEVIRKLLYPKTPPIITLTASNAVTNVPFVEIGTTASINVSWNLTIFPRNEKEYISNYMISRRTGNLETTSSFTGLSFSGRPGKTFSGVAGLVAASFSSPTQSLYSFYATDVWPASSYPTGFSFSATASVGHVWPIYYGFTNSNITTTALFNNGIKSLNKTALPYPGASGSISIPINGEGYLYVIYEKNTFKTPISRVTDPNGFVVHNMIDITNSIFSSSTRSGGFFLNGNTTNGQLTQWVIYRSINLCSFNDINNFVIRF